MKRVIVALALWGWAFGLFAQSICSSTDQVIYYGNGVGFGAESAHQAATEAKIEIQLRLVAVMPTDQYNRTSFNLAYNQSEGFLLDVLEAARQQLGNEYPALAVALLLNRSGLSEVLDFLGVGLTPEQIQSFNDFVRNGTVQALIQGSASNVTVLEHVGHYTTDINEGKKVVLIAHSQGNIFANLAFTQLPASQAQSFTIIPVASPESTVRKSLVGHVRFLNDFVIGAVDVGRSLLGLPGPLPANDLTTVGISTGFHGFVDAYLTDSSAANFILSSVPQSLSGLTPSGNLGQGAITVTLTWGSNPDVDIHIFEPTGFHVFYIQKNGNVGFLDRDVVTSFGPEHYFASCNNLKTNPLAIGTYRVGLNYFRGSSPEIATVTLKTPGNERTFTKLLPSAFGFPGNGSPVPVADVTVTKDPQTGRLDFFIQGL